jgi:DnaJ-class molecular chaperone
MADCKTCKGEGMIPDLSTEHTLMTCLDCNGTGNALNKTDLMESIRTERDWNKQTAFSANKKAKEMEEYLKWVEKNK